MFVSLAGEDVFVPRGAVFVFLVVGHGCLIDCCGQWLSSGGWSDEEGHIHDKQPFESNTYFSR